MEIKRDQFVAITATTDRRVVRYTPANTIPVNRRDSSDGSCPIAVIPIELAGLVNQIEARAEEIEQSSTCHLFGDIGMSVEVMRDHLRQELDTQPGDDDVKYLSDRVYDIDAPIVEFVDIGDKEGTIPVPMNHAITYDGRVVEYSDTDVLTDEQVKLICLAPYDYNCPFIILTRPVAIDLQSVLQKAISIIGLSGSVNALQLSRHIYTLTELRDCIDMTRTISLD